MLEKEQETTLKRQEQETHNETRQHLKARLENLERDFIAETDKSKKNDLKVTIFQIFNLSI